MLIPLQWSGLFAVAAVFVVMFALGAMLGREQIAATLERRVVLAAVIFALGAAVAAAMRNPGVALMIATLNRAPPTVTAAIIGYAIGLALAMIMFLQWRKRVGAR